MRELAMACLMVMAFGTVQAGEQLTERQSALRHMVLHDCGSCHGMTLKGGLGPPLLPGTLEGKDTEMLVDTVLNGVPRTPMAPWRFQINAAEARWIVESLQEGQF